MTAETVRRIAPALAILAGVATVAGQVPASAPAQAPPRFRVGVDLIRVDAVVTDQAGRPVSDLRPEEFVVRQDGRSQRVVSTQFVPVAVDPPAAPAASRSLVREQVQRTLVMMVDDLGLSFGSLGDARRALHAFVDRDLLPSDVVAIVSSGGARRLAQRFTSDPRVLHAAIDALRWNGFSRDAGDVLTPWTTTFSPDPRRTSLNPANFDELDALRETVATSGTLGALHLVVRSLGNMPGRKAVVFVSEGFRIRGFERDELTVAPDVVTRRALDAVTDQAIRSGVVLYALDASGLQVANASARQDALFFLAEQTGGFAVVNTNALAPGLSRIARDMGSYYVVAYEPEAGTFAAPGRTARYHSLSIQVSRPGLRVRTRREFFGVSDPPAAISAPTPAQALVAAASSPFAETRIRMRTAALPGFDPVKGLFIRTLVQIDARELSFTQGTDARRLAGVDVVGLVFDREGAEVGHLSTGFEAVLSGSATDDALRDGVAYTLTIPVKRAGAYQVRFAVRDRTSGELGASGEFVDVADVPGGVFALSGIVLHDGASAGEASAARMTLTSSQAERSYNLGTELGYAYEIYNPGPEVQVALSLWRGTTRVFAGAPDRLVAPADPGRPMAAAGRFRLNAALTPGPYVLQIIATSPTASGRGRIRTAVQRVDFEVRAPRTGD